MSERDRYDSYPFIMNRAQQLLEASSRYIVIDGRGGMVTMVAADSDSVELSSLLQRFAGDLGIKATEVEHVDVGRILNAFELGLISVTAEIPEDHLEKQDPIENTFEYIFRGFGKNGEGWRNSFWGRQDDAVRSLNALKEFIHEKNPIIKEVMRMEMDLDLDTSAPRMLVLNYPPLHEIVEVNDAEDVDISKLTPDQSLRIRRYLAMYAIVRRSYYHMFEKNNPQGNVVVNVVDPLYKWFMARFSEFRSTYERMDNVIALPSAHDRDLQIYYSNSR